PKIITVPTELKANVEGAAFIVDGRPETSPTPSLEAGKEHVIEASHDGYETAVQRFTPSQTAANQVELVLKPLAEPTSPEPELIPGAETATLQIQPAPPQAEILIDGRLHQARGANGSRSLLLKAGKHRVQVLAPGYADSPERMIDIRHGARKKEVFALKALPAQLNDEGVAPRATVYLDGT